jgi:hypothetical protein
MSKFRSTKRWMKRQIRRYRNPGEEKKLVIVSLSMSCTVTPTDLGYRDTPPTFGVKI